MPAIYVLWTRKAYSFTFGITMRMTTAQIWVARVTLNKEVIALSACECQFPSVPQRW